MEKYYIIKVNNSRGISDWTALENKALLQFNSTGVEDFNIEEEKVDEILGERSYSGADLPQSVIDEVEATVLAESSTTKNFYFAKEDEAQVFQNYLTTEFSLHSELFQEDAKDWNAEWKKSYKPILINNELEIVPSWLKGEYKSASNKQLYIYPGMGFGTGNHETTFLCLKLMFEVDYSFEGIRCMDFGCGSGILGLALRLFQKKSHIDLYDIDQAALNNCKQNLDLNEFDEEGIRYMLTEDRSKFLVHYDLVFANILKNVLQFESEGILSIVKPGGSLIVSGLLSGQEQDIIDLYTSSEKNILHIQTVSKGDWVAVLFKRSDNQ